MPWQLRRDLCQDMWWLHVNVPPMCHLSFYSELISQRCASFLGFALTQMKTCRRCTGTQQQHTSNICHKIRLSLFIPTAEEQEIISVCSGDTPPPPQPWNLQQGFQTESGKWYYAKIKYVVTPAQTLNWGSGERTRAACRGTGGKVRAPWRKLCSLMLFWLIYWDFLWFFWGFFYWKVGVDSPPISQPCESCQLKLNSFNRCTAAWNTWPNTPQWDPSHVQAWTGSLQAPIILLSVN